MSTIGYTSGGSPVFWNKTSIGKRNGKPLYPCSLDEKHKLTKNQAKSSGYRCTHCGGDLKVRKHKLKELKHLANSLGVSILLEEGENHE